MNFSDAHDILGFNQTNKDEPSTSNYFKKKRRRNNQMKRPECMHRELYRLLDDEESVGSLVPSLTKYSGYQSQKAEIGMKSVRPWLWHPFKNAGRDDDLELYHWQRTDRLETPEIYPFARFNRVLDLLHFSGEDYDRYLTSPKWTKDDTNHLFDLCRQFDLRWIVIADRWKGSKKISIEQLKERFYSILTDLEEVKGGIGEIFFYDAEHEKRRKEQLNKLWNRTAAEVEEEEMLIVELRKIEVRRKEREKKAQDLQRLIAAGEKVSSAANCRNKASSASSLQSENKSASTDYTPLRFPEFRNYGAHLRSQEMKLPTNIGQRKLKNIEDIIDKLKLESMPFAAEDIAASFNDLRSSIILLQELKHLLQSAEFDLESLRTRYNSMSGMSFDIEPRMRVSTLSEEGYGEASAVSGVPSSNRLIVDLIELSTSMPQMRKKRTNPQSSPSSVTSADVKRKKI